MGRLLQKMAVENKEIKEYTQKLLAAFSVQTETHLSSLTPQPLVDPPLVDPLSKRELEVLTLIAAGLKNKEIAAELIISLNTVLYHVKNIYSKLGANKRTLAIAKAKKHNII